MRAPLVSKQNSFEKPMKKGIAMKRVIYSLGFSISLLLVFCAGCVAQQVRNTDYKADQALKSNARVNPSTLAMELSIPVGGYQGRAGTGVPIVFNYSSKVWQIYAPPGSSWQEQYGTIITDTKPLYARRSAAGWTSNLGVPRIDYELGIYEGFHEGSSYEGQAYSPYIPYGSNPGPSNYYLHYIKRVQVTMPDGSSHEFRKDDTINAYGTMNSPGGYGLPDMIGTFLSVDGSKMRLDLASSQSTLFLPDGSCYLFDQNAQQATTFIDRNGNKMTFNLATRQWTDTMGRVVTDPIPLNWQPFEQSQIVEDKVAQFPGKDSGTFNVTFSWRYLKDPNGGESGLEDMTQSLRYTSDKYCQGNLEHNVPGSYLFNNPEISIARVCAPGYSSAGPPFNPIALTKITLPNGQSYQFKYNVFGEISKIIYPTGAYERFQYAQTLAVQGSEASYEQANRGVVDRWVSAKGDGTDEIHWSYAATQSYQQPYKVVTSNPDGTKTEQYLFCEPTSNPQPYGFGDAKTGRSYEDRVLSSTDQLLVRKLTKYTWTGPQSGGAGSATRDLRPEKEISIIFEPGNGNALASMTETVYDTTGSSDPAFFSSLNPKQQKTYHYVVVNASTAASANIATAAGWFSSATPAVVTEMDYFYDPNYKARNINGLATETRIKDASGNVKAKSQISYDEVGTYPLLTDVSSTRWEDPNSNYRGLVTTTRSWSDIANNLYVETRAQYDQLGNLRKSWDGKGNLSQVEYSSTYDHAYPTKTISPIPGGNGSTTAFETTVIYDFNTGLPTSTTDVNGQTSTMEYVDPLLRPTKVIAPNGHQTITEYGAGTTAATRFVKVRSQIDTDKWKEGYSWYDGLGRTIKSQSVDDDGDVFALTCYDNMGRIAKASNPFRNWNNETCTSALEWTSNTFDTAGRPWKVTTPDGAVVETIYGLATSGASIGTVVTVKDQALKERRSVTNALGQLVRVDEPNNTGQLGAVTSPNQPTNYSYNTLGKMIRVQQGVQNRYFMYDSLGRTLRVKQPEQEVNTALNTTGNPDNNSWSAGFTYDNNGNVLTTTDAKGTVITSAYDALNRPLTQTYSDGTPTVTNYYDDSTVASSKGKLTKVTSSISETTYTSFDVVGRLVSSTQRTPLAGETVANAAPRTSGYIYNLSGALVQETYPSGRIVKTEIDASGDLSKVTSQKAGGSVYAPYASNISYSAAGAVTSMRLGNGKWETASFNSRLQPVQLGLGASIADTGLWKVNYEYGELQTNGTVDALKNNGNIAKQSLTVPGTNFVQAYKYDPLNRLTEAKETTGTTQNWTQNWSYDVFGNRSTFTQNIAGNTAATNPTVDQNTNRFNAGQGFVYDKNGNIIQDVDAAIGHSRQFIFNGDNKQTQVNDISANQTKGTYFYDGEGKRVKKVTETETTVFVYSSGKLVAEYSTAIASAADAKTAYTTTDHLGSPRIITDQLGQVKSRRDFMPFGEDLFVNIGSRTTALKYSSSQDDIRQKFTGYQKDTETNLDFAEARMYENRFGRFTAVDPLTASGKSANPQTFNRFIYVRNNPLVLVDPSGLIGVKPDIIIIENGPTTPRSGEKRDSSDSKDGNPIGHTAIAITGKGVFSAGNGEKEPQTDNKNNIVGGSVKDYLTRELTRRDTKITIIKTTPEQDEAVAAKFMEIAKSKDKLTANGILSDNCSTRANEALDASGLKGGNEMVSIPNTQSLTNPEVQPMQIPARNIPGSAGQRATTFGNEPTTYTIQKNTELSSEVLKAILPFEPKSKVNK
ncbi:MAG: RHS repeat-associated core domain-containing protein [Pyrinomonadaceae bacterium]